jgi:RNA recognition motif-containing protein
MNLYIGNLDPASTAASLRTLFEEFGEVTGSKIIIDNATGMSRGFGFVEMAEKGAGHVAIDNLDQSYFEGNIISVKEAKQNNTNQRGGGGGPHKRFNNNNGGSNSGNRPFRPRQRFDRNNSSNYNRNSDGSSSYNRNSDGSSNYNRNSDGSSNYNRNSDNSQNYNRSNDNRSGGLDYDPNSIEVDKF